jgi:hypothetical protein
MTAQPDRPAADLLASRPWRGAEREYDLFKELTIGVVVVGVLIAILAAVAGSPDESPITLKSWATADAADFRLTAASELAGTSGTATYGPPYSTTAGATQTLGPLDLQSFSGRRLPIDTARDLVITPLTVLHLAPGAVATWNAAPSAQRTAWATAYSDALTKAAGKPVAAVAADGPAPALTSALLTAAQRNSLDGVIQAESGPFSIDSTRSLLFLGDGAYFPGLATAQHLTGDQWGVMNETGSWPGQAWLWLFSFWYQVPAFGNLSNADLVIVLIMGVLTVALALVPFIPGIRSLPRLIPVHRLIWRDYYRNR